MTEDADLVFEAELEAPPEKVWRALSIPEYRDRWLDRPADVDIAVVNANDNSLLTLSWTERNQTSVVTIELTPLDNGGTGFRLTHAPPAANSNAPVARLALAA